MLDKLVILGVILFGGWFILELSERKNKPYIAINHISNAPISITPIYLEKGKTGEYKDKEVYISGTSVKSNGSGGISCNVLAYSENIYWEGRNIYISFYPPCNMLRKISESNSKRFVIKGIFRSTYVNTKRQILSRNSTSNKPTYAWTLNMDITEGWVAN